MAPWVYDEKFLVGTQFLFGTLMFTAGEDENLELQVQDPPSHQWAPIYVEAPYYPVDPLSTKTLASDGARSSLNHFAGLYTLTAMMSWRQPIEAPMF
jgi:hypothetical protein